MTQDILFTDKGFNDRGSCRSYERFVLLNPHIRTEGLYTDGLHFVIVCPNLEDSSMSSDGRPINKWLEDCRDMCCPISLSTHVPSEWQLVPERSISDLTHGRGKWRNIRSVMSDLLSLLPRDFPKINVMDGEKPGIIGIGVERDLTSLEIENLRSAVETLHLDARVVVRIDVKNAIKPFEYRTTKGPADIDIIPSSLFQWQSFKYIKKSWEKDEDLWIRNKEQVINGKFTDKRLFFPSGWSDDKSVCFIDYWTHEHQDIRTCLTVYDCVIIGLPFRDNFSKLLDRLKCSEQELIDLAKISKIAFAVPQSIDRYPVDFLDRVASEAPDSLLLPRQLASVVLLDARQRRPFLFPPFGIRERREFLSCLSLLFQEETKITPKSFMSAVIDGLGKIWFSYHDSINDRASMGISFHSLTPLYASILKNKTNRDFTVEMITVSHLVAIGGAFGASVVPLHSKDYSEENLTRIFADFYSGRNIKNFPIFESRHADILNGVLSISSDVPLLTIARDFSSSDVHRLRRLIVDLARGKSPDQEDAKVVDAFNKEVNSFRSRKDSLAEWDVSGFVLAVAPLILTKYLKDYPEILPLIDRAPLALWLLQRMFEQVSENPDVRKMLDWMVGIINITNSDIVMVARLRDKIKK